MTTPTTVVVPSQPFDVHQAAERIDIGKEGLRQRGVDDRDWRPFRAIVTGEVAPAQQSQPGGPGVPRCRHDRVDEDTLGNIGAGHLRR